MHVSWSSYKFLQLFFVVWFRVFHNKKLWILNFCRIYPLKITLVKCCLLWKITISIKAFQLTFLVYTSQIANWWWIVNNIWIRIFYCCSFHGKSQRKPWILHDYIWYMLVTSLTSHLLQFIPRFYRYFDSDFVFVNRRDHLEFQLLIQPFRFEITNDNPLITDLLTHLLNRPFWHFLAIRTKRHQVWKVLDYTILVKSPLKNNSLFELSHGILRVVLVEISLFCIVFGLEEENVSSKCYFEFSEHLVGFLL